ncbi:hypothetical protein FISHEDRAFT_55216 [Fistulina hepatica ATCC 64428]|uniref:Uncharacterized protein n=1 Tax=Fistulina hepatica ATCC 64428 TaxID=1128425 RepID=A0A0D7ARB8_9AGAR|nr:hypothetical protein FISHEDRAFT_55216 [Fistulina hepatica ATCC 64428]
MGCRTKPTAQFKQTHHVLALKQAIVADFESPSDGADKSTTIEVSCENICRTWYAFERESRGAARPDPGNLSTCEKSAVKNKTHMLVVLRLRLRSASATVAGAARSHLELRNQWGLKGSELNVENFRWHLRWKTYRAFAPDGVLSRPCMQMADSRRIKLGGGTIQNRRWTLDSPYERFGVVQKPEKRVQTADTTARESTKESYGIMREALGRDQFSAVGDRLGN